MTASDNKQITEREIREAELQMTGRPPASPTGFIGFVPASPATSNGGETTGAGQATKSDDK